MFEKGFTRFYQGWSDYLPGYLYVLWFLGKVKALVPIPEVLLYKLPAIVADVLTGGLIYLIVGKLKNSRWGLMTAALYLFNPAVIANSTLWGQVDSLTALFSLLAIYLTNISPLGSAVALATGTLIKPQAAFVAPVIGYLMLKDKWPISRIMAYVGVGGLIVLAGFLPFAGGHNLIPFIWGRLGVTLNQYPYTSINAFNFWGLFGFWRSDQTRNLSFLIPLLIFLFAAVRLWKKEKTKYFLASLCFGATFLFLARMHERHLLPTLAPLAIAASLAPNLWLVYLGFSLTYVANLYYSYNWITKDFLSVFPPEIIKALVLLNLGLFGFLIFELFQKKQISFSSIGKFFQKKAKTARENFPKIKISPVSTRIILFVILGFAFGSRILFLGSPPNEYFDEVYHAFTARRMLHADPKAWEWWNTPPTGFAYEWTHPPLAKEAMVLGMTLLGENAFGWRVVQALLGVACVFLVYLIARNLFKDEILALLAGGVFSLDGLPLVMSRIGMNDTFFLFFALLAFYFFLKDRNLFSAVTLGLAAASKWSVFWLAPIFGVAFISLRKKISLSLLLFVLIPPLVYLASYLPMFTSGHTWEQFIEVQKQMWWYHTNLKATHAYTSPWWNWPFLVRPVWLYTSGAVQGLIANIYAMGNPVVFWFGLISIFLSFVLAFKERSKKLALVVFAYLAFFVPWALSPRIMFLYHYLPSIPFLAIATGYVLRKYPKMIWGFLIIAFLIFVYFYPHWTGIKIPVWLDNSYYWFNSWR